MGNHAKRTTNLDAGYRKYIYLHLLGIKKWGMSTLHAGPPDLYNWNWMSPMLDHDIDGYQIPEGADISPQLDSERD